MTSLSRSHNHLIPFENTNFLAELVPRCYEPELIIREYVLDQVERLGRDWSGSAILGWMVRNHELSYRIVIQEMPLDIEFTRAKWTGRAPDSSSKNLFSQSWIKADIHCSPYFILGWASTIGANYPHSVLHPHGFFFLTYMHFYDGEDAVA